MIPHYFYCFCVYRISLDDVMHLHHQNKAWNAEEIFDCLVIVQSDILLNALVSVRAQDAKWGAKVNFSQLLNNIM